MGKCIDKLNDYIITNKGTKRVKFLQFFAPLLVLVFLKIVIFFDSFLLPSRQNFCAILFLYCSALFIVVILLSIYRYIEKKLCLKKIKIPFKILLLSPFIVLAALYWFVTTFGKDYGLLEFLIMLAILAYAFFLWLPFFIYFQVKKKGCLLFESIINLKLSFYGLIICIFFDISIYSISKICNIGEWFDDYLIVSSSCFYLTFFILNLISCVKSKLTKSRVSDI